MNDMHAKLGDSQAAGIILFAGDGNEDLVLSKAFRQTMMKLNAFAIFGFFEFIIITNNLN